MPAHLVLNADALRRQRLAAGLSQAALADKSGVHFVTISRLETGKRPATVGTIQRLSAALGVQVTDIAAIQETVCA